MADRRSVVRVVVRPNTYLDSLTLLRVSSAVATLPGVLDAAVVMGTPLNQEVLRESGLLADTSTRSEGLKGPEGWATSGGLEAASVGPNDLVLAVRAHDSAAAEAALHEAERLLSDRTRRFEAGSEAETPGEEPPRSIRSAHRRAPGANLALISVPGPFAAAEAHQALSEGLHVFLFSDNVALADEVALKKRASAARCLLMGPDCGTAIINGVGLGFANVVRRGGIGLTGASGTGLQELSVLIHQAGLGVSHAIGTGGRDLHAEVGGITTLQALNLLRDDPETKVIVLASKPPAPEVAERVLRAAADTGKPVVACLLDARLRLTPPKGIRLARTLAEAAALAAGSFEAPRPAAVEQPARARGRIQPAAGPVSPGGRPGRPVEPPSFGPGGLSELERPNQAAAGRASSSGTHVLGLFCGGTLAEEADQILEGVPHTTIDFGDDRYTRGRLHPMIDPTLRNQAIVEAAANPQVGVLLLDVILGYGTHPDPAGVVGPVIRQAIELAAADGRHLSVLGHLLGTDLDPQPFFEQDRQLREAGVQLYLSNAAAAEAARGLLAT